MLLHVSSTTAGGARITSDGATGYRADESESATSSTPADDDTATEPTHDTEQSDSGTEDDRELEPSPAHHDHHTMLEANGLIVEITDDDTLQSL